MPRKEIIKKPKQYNQLIFNIGSLLEEARKKAYIQNLLANREKNY